MFGSDQRILFCQEGCQDFCLNKSLGNEQQNCLQLVHMLIVPCNVVNKPMDVQFAVEGSARKWYMWEVSRRRPVMFASLATWCLFEMHAILDDIVHMQVCVKETEGDCATNG